MSELAVEVDAAEVGLDSERLKRIDAHFAGYVADGRLPGWLLTVRRHGRLAHMARCGSRDLEAGLPVTDDTVLGRVVEVASGQRLDEFFADRILRPLGMTGTAFSAGPAAQPRLAALYSPGPDGKATRLDALGQAALKQPRLLSGGSGLVSTAADYDRFTQMLLPRPGSPAGELDGIKLLSPRTVAYMARNHLPGGLDLETFGRPLFAEAPFRGFGFGLGFAVLLDPVPGKVIGSPGEISWGGAASTAFWVDQEADLTVSFFTQLLPSSTYPIRPQLRQLVYQALTD